MKLKVLIRKNVELARCPSCNSIATLKKSRSRNIFEKGLKFIGFRAFICRSCGWRGRYYKLKLAKNGVKVILLYVFTILLTLFIVRYFLIRTFQ